MIIVKAATSIWGNSFDQVWVNIALDINSIQRKRGNANYFFLGQTTSRPRRALSRSITSLALLIVELVLQQPSCHQIKQILT